MITNMWGKMDLYCGNCYPEKEGKMNLQQKPSGVAYTCPFCKNTFSLKDIEKMFDKLGHLMIAAEKEDELLDIKNISFSIGKCSYKVLDHGERLKITGINARSMIK